jgi:hypothetical protein
MFLARALNALTHNCPAYAGRVNLHSSAELYGLNASIRAGRRDQFLYHLNRGDPHDAEDAPLWPRFACWSTDDRVCVHVPTLLLYLGTPTGGK